MPPHVTMTDRGFRFGGGCGAPGSALRAVPGLEAARRVSLEGGVRVHGIVQTVHVTDAHVELVSEFLDRLRALNYSPVTIGAYSQIVRRFLRAYPGVPVEKLTAEHIERALHARRMSPRSFCTNVLTLHTFFEFLRQHKHLIRRNPSEAIDLPKWSPKRRPCPSWEEFVAIRRACRTVEEAAILEVLYFTGLRISELRAIRLRDVDLRQRQIHVISGKGGKARTVVFLERVATVLRLHCWRSGILHPDAYLFTNVGLGRHRPRGAVWINSLLHRLGQEAGLPYRLTAHLMRHGFTRLCKVRGVPLDVASRLLGHSSIQTTSKLYGQLDVSDLQAVYNRQLEG